MVLINRREEWPLKTQRVSTPFLRYQKKTGDCRIYHKMKKMAGANTNTTEMNNQI